MRTAISSVVVTYDGTHPGALAPTLEAISTYPSTQPIVGAVVASFSDEGFVADVEQEFKIIRVVNEGAEDLLLPSLYEVDGRPAVAFQVTNNAPSLAGLRLSREYMGCASCYFRWNTY